MSLFCDNSSETASKQQVSQEFIIYNLFQIFFLKKDGLKIDANEYVLKMNNVQDKINNGITNWKCNLQNNDLTIRISFQLKDLTRQLEKRLANQLNKQCKFFKILYKKPKMTFDIRLNLLDKHNLSKFFQKQIKQILINITSVIDRVKQIQKDYEKLQPFQDLYSMRQSFQFNRSSRSKSSRISLITKKNKNITEILKLLAQGSLTLNQLQSTYFQRDNKKYNQYKKKIHQCLQANAKNINKAIQQSILTSIQILNYTQQKIICFQDQNKTENLNQQALSIISKALYTFKKQITIHKDIELQNFSQEICRDILVKKQKTQKGSNQFQNQIKFLTYIKGTFHQHIADYYCQLEEWPFKSKAVYVQYYETSLHKVKHTLSYEKKLRIIYQISKVLTFLNYRKICHRDLKQDNILIDANMDVKVIDWGSVSSMHTTQLQSGNLKVKDQRLFSTQGYFQRYYEDIFHQQFGKKYTREEIQKGQFFDIYSFSFIIQKLFQLQNSDMSYWLDMEINYICLKCRQKNPADRMSAIQLEIYLTLLRKKLKKLTLAVTSSPVSVNQSSS